MRCSFVSKYFSAAALVALSAGGSALAADMGAPVYKASPPKPATYNWTGFYVGGNAGYGWGRSIGLSENNNIDFIAQGGVPASIAGSPEGFVGGGQLGYNWQAPGSSWVWGFEIDLAATDISSSQDVTGMVGVPRFTHGEQKLDWLATFRARLGYAPTDRLLVYATGGLALGDASSSISVTTTVPNDVAACVAANIGACMGDSRSKTLTGWTFGGGFEYALAGNWSVKGEYLYYDLGHINTAATDSRFLPPAVFFGNNSFSGSIVRGGINYKFDWGAPIVAKY